MEFLNAWHHLQKMQLTYEQREALLTLYRLGPKERKAIMLLVPPGPRPTI
ncbi:hypothetical protein PHMEG_00027984 [Phytophthora megakarya]|uniref:Uncharacterized protein n=1 Tax=Phytophthora megakarya TaxID=4795 RepID=A0A225V4C5_9STRA|nr:hypothetical protein PHMEG_00027984 [Phytophthora megakarya]